MALHNQFGREAEKKAARYLERKGYRILERNWRFGKAEIDIIAQENDTLVIVEVKARTGDYFGDPASFVNKKKIALLTEAANEYCLQKNWNGEVRFDIISIVQKHQGPDLQHIENAFYWF